MVSKTKNKNGTGLSKADRCNTRGLSGTKTVRGRGGRNSEAAQQVNSETVQQVSEYASKTVTADKGLILGDKPQNSAYNKSCRILEGWVEIWKRGVYGNRERKVEQPTGSGSQKTHQKDTPAETS